MKKLLANISLLALLSTGPSLAQTIPIGPAGGGGSGSSATMAIGSPITGGTSGYGLFVNGAALGQFAYGTGVYIALGNALNATSGLISYGGNSATNTNPYDSSAQVATDAFVQNALLLSMATVPMAITGGTYSFASTANPLPVMDCVASAGAVTSCTVNGTGGNGVAVGDVFSPSSGNHDALIRVLTISSGHAATFEVVYGGTGYTTAIGMSSQISSAVPYTYILSGTLTSNVTFIATNGTYLTASQQWFVANNTTGAYTVTACVSNGSDACSAGRTAVIPQGTNNSRLVGVQTDGQLNIDIASIINVNDLQGLGTGVATALAATPQGSGSVVLATSPTITTPTISGTSTFTAQLTSATGTGLILNSVSGQATSFDIGGSASWFLTAGGTFRPAADIAVNLGASAQRINTGYFATLGASGTPITTAYITSLGASGTPVTNAYIAGTTAGGAATAGQLGEIISSSIASASAVSQPTSGTAITITSVALTAGDWDCEGSAITKPAGTTTTSVFTAGMNTTAATLPTAPAGGYFSTVATPGAAVAETAPLVRQQYNSSSSATVYLVGNATFAASTMSLYGQISCRRVR